MRTLWELVANEVVVNARREVCSSRLFLRKTTRNACQIKRKHATHLFVDIYAESPRVVELRHQVDIREGGFSTGAKWAAWMHEGLGCLQAVGNPCFCPETHRVHVIFPCARFNFFEIGVVGKKFEHTKILNGLRVTAEDVNDFSYLARCARSAGRSGRRRQRSYSRILRENSGSRRSGQYKIRQFR